MRVHKERRSGISTPYSKGRNKHGDGCPWGILSWARSLPRSDCNWASGNGWNPEPLSERPVIPESVPPIENLRNGVNETNFTYCLLYEEFLPASQGTPFRVGFSGFLYNRKQTRLLQDFAFGTKDDFFLKTWRSTASFPKHLYKKANPPPFFQPSSRPLHPS